MALACVTWFCRMIDFWRAFWPFVLAVFSAARALVIAASAACQVAVGPLAHWS